MSASCDEIMAITLQVGSSDFQRFTGLSTEVHIMCATPSLSHKKKECRKWVNYLYTKTMLANRLKTSDQGF
jgi:hypothetical protein